jgi:hypothetical protein
MAACVANASFRKGADEIYRCEPFEQFGWLKHGFATKASRLPGLSITTLRQVHSAHVFDAEGLRDRQCEGDALVSNQPGKWIGVRTADCVPILLADHRTRAVAAIHAGWKGTAASIVRHAIDQMSTSFGTHAMDIHAAIGPAIRVCCYEVGREVAAAGFEELFPEGLRPHSQDGHVMLDLVEANRRILTASGVPAAQIYDSGLCTFCCRDEFHSYRRDPSDRGRMVSFVSRHG